MAVPGGRSTPPSPPPGGCESPHDFARRCEDLAAAYLAGLGWRILARNWRCAGGELDLVARDGRTTVFVEVKGKRGGSLGEPAEMVDRRKVGRLVASALAWIADAPAPTGPCRFDVVAINELAGVEPRLDHIRDAFTLHDG